MIKYNEKNISSPKISSSIKTKCKIKYNYYYIQIYIESFANSENITFLIKSKKENERKSILYKRAFNYNELINYNKYFKNFSSFEDIFINISQCIEEKKYNITSNSKCLSLIFKMYIAKLKRHVNICINLNEHKNLHPLSMNNSKTKEIKKIMMGIQNEEELSYAIYDIRQRLKNLEMNQSIMNNNNKNYDNTYRNNNIKPINNNLQRYINNSSNLIENMNNNDFQIRYYDKTLNRRKFNNKISANSSMNNYNEESNLFHHNNSVMNKTNIRYIKNSTENIFTKNTKMNQKNRISGVNELIKKINDLESTMNSKDRKEKMLDYKLNYIDSSNYQYKYLSNIKKNRDINNHSNFNKSVDIIRRNDNSLYNLNTTSNINNTTQISLVKKDKLNVIVNREKSMNGSQIVDDNDKFNNKKSNIYKNDDSNYKDNITNKLQKSEKHKKEKSKKINNNNINDEDKIIKEKVNNVIKFINKTAKKKNKAKNENFVQNNKMEINESNNKKEFNINNEIEFEKNNKKEMVLINKKDFDIKNEEEKIINKKSNDNGNSLKNENESEQKMKNKKKIINKVKSNKKKIKDNSNEISNKKQHNKIKIKEKEKEKENGNNSNNNIENLNGKNNIIIENKNSQKEEEKVKKVIIKESSEKVESRNSNKMPKMKIKNFSAIKDSSSKNSNNYNNFNINNSVNSLASKPIVKHNVNRSISSSMSNVIIHSPRKLPIYPPEKLEYIDSTIIFRKEEFNLLKNKISHNNKKLRIYFDLLYRATRDGDNEKVIKKKTLGYEKVITLFYTNEGARFGIFIRRKKNHYIKAKDRGEKPGTSFIFGLNNLVIYDIYKDKYGKGDYNQVLCFGCLNKNGINGTKWMIFTPQNNFLQKKCIMDYGEGLYRDIDIEQIVGPSEYTIKEVEIFHVDIENENDDSF